MMPILVCYHCLFWFGNPPELNTNAVDIVGEQMDQVNQSGLLDAASEMIVGINGGLESRDVAEMVLPQKAVKVYHGLNSKSENLTIVALESWLKTHPGWLVWYFHSKCATHTPGTQYHDFSTRWRRLMIGHLVERWQVARADLEAGAEAVGANWMQGQCDGTQNYFAGNFFAARSDYLRILPSIYARERIKISGIGSVESRFEAEVWLGNGPRLPKVKTYSPGGLG